MRDNQLVLFLVSLKFETIELYKVNYGQDLCLRISFPAEQEK